MRPIVRNPRAGIVGGPACQGNRSRQAAAAAPQTMARLDAERWRLIWTYHYVLMDGWAVSRLMGEVLRLCRVNARQRAGRAIATISPGWTSRDPAADEAFWRRTRAISLRAVPAGPGGRPRTRRAVACHRPGPFPSAWRRAPCAPSRSRNALPEYAGAGRMDAGPEALLRRRHGNVRRNGLRQSRRAAGAEETLGLFINTQPGHSVAHRQPTRGRLGCAGCRPITPSLRDHALSPLYDIQRFKAAQGAGCCSTASWCSRTIPSTRPAAARAGTAAWRSARSTMSK